MPDQSVLWRTRHVKGTEARLHAWIVGRQFKAKQQAERKRLAKSNRQRAGAQSRASRTLLGGGSAHVATSLGKQGKMRGKRGVVIHTMPVVNSAGKVKLMSRLPGSWSDMMRERISSTPVRYDPAYLAGLSHIKSLHNPNMVTDNVSTVRVWEWSDKLGKAITKTKRIEHGGTYQAPARKLVMRGDPCLFDDCASLDPQGCNGEPRTAYHRDVITNRDRSKRIVYHDMAGTLPSYTVAPIVKRGSADLASMVAEWRDRTALQLDLVEYLLR